MTDMNMEKERKPRSRTWLAIGAMCLVLAALASGGWAWHQEPNFCAVCHTPMRSYVDGYQGGDPTLMAAQHASGETALVCVDCHEMEIIKDATLGLHWMTGNYVFPLQQREFGTSGFCLAAGCHDEGKIIEATKDYGGATLFNLHDPRHGKQQCYRCHLSHEKSVLMCNQCHRLKLPDGWISPSVTGVIASR
jgi:hypothetical protein